MSISSNPILYGFLMYIFLAGPLTFFMWLFVSWFVCEFDDVILRESTNKGSTQRLIDELANAVWTLEPRGLMLVGWVIFPVSVLMALMVCLWYIGLVTHSFAPD